MANLIGPYYQEAPQKPEGSTLFPQSLSLFLAPLGLCGSAWASHCGGFSCGGAQALGTWASAVVTHGLSICGSQALERRLCSCGARA